GALVHKNGGAARGGGEAGPALRADLGKKNNRQSTPDQPLAGFPGYRRILNSRLCRISLIGGNAWHAHTLVSLSDSAELSCCWVETQSMKYRTGGTKVGSEAFGIAALLRPHWRAIALAFLAVVGEIFADLL